MPSDAPITALVVRRVSARLRAAVRQESGLTAAVRQATIEATEVLEAVADRLERVDGWL